MKGIVCVLNILVYNIAADSGGALSILNDLYTQVCMYKDKSIHWHFILSTPEFLPAPNVHIHRFPYIKNGWHRRLEFDYTMPKELVQKYNIDKILSLQNIPVPIDNIPQAVYFHQSLPFYPDKISFFNSTQRIYWIYKNIIGRKITRSLKKADLVIVQSNWIKNTCIDKGLVSPEKIKVISPDMPHGIYPAFDKRMSSFRTFFYPASGAFYKNHKVILNAAKLLMEKGIKAFRLIFTLSKKDKEGAIIYNMAKQMQLPVSFIGQIGRDDVMANFSSSVLIFPSIIETFGLPLAEAKKCNTPIIVSDKPFAREVLSGYKNAIFFDPYNANELAEIMLKVIHQDVEYTAEDNIFLGQRSENGMIKLIEEMILL